MMARGAWARAMTPACIGAGVEMSADPYGLFSEDGGDVAPYDPSVFQAMQGSETGVT